MNVSESFKERRKISQLY